MAGSADYSIKPDLSYRPQTVDTKTEPEPRARPPQEGGGGLKFSKVQLATAPLRLPYIIRQIGSNRERWEGSRNTKGRVIRPGSVLLPGTSAVYGPSRRNKTAAGSGPFSLAWQMQRGPNVRAHDARGAIHHLLIHVWTAGHVADLADVSVGRAPRWRLSSSTQRLQPRCYAK